MVLLAPLCLTSLCLATPCLAETARAEFDPVTASLTDILECRIDAGAYMGFAITISDEDSPSSAKARGWHRLPSPSPFFSAYRLAKPLTAFGLTTSTVAFTGSAMLGVFDLPDPAALGVAQKVANDYAGSGLFKGERVVDDSIEIDRVNGYRFKKHSALQIATNHDFPGKTLAGCSYTAELEPLAK